MRALVFLATLFAISAFAAPMTIDHSTCKTFLFGDMDAKANLTRELFNKGYNLVPVMPSDLLIKVEHDLNSEYVTEPGRSFTRYNCTTRVMIYPSEGKDPRVLIETFTNSETAGDCKSGDLSAVMQIPQCVTD